MSIKTVKFKGSFPKESTCPKSEFLEYAFVGRSNVGKSSLLNYLVGNSSMAQVSSKPGKTQMLNYFEVNEAWFLVDLPGYGYAKLSKKHRNSLKKMVHEYLENRTLLCCAFVLIDCNIPPQKVDIEFIEDLGENKVPFSIVFTKSDKSEPEEVEKNILAFREKLLETWQFLPEQFVTSSLNNEGGEELLNYIEQINQKATTDA